MRPSMFALSLVVSVVACNSAPTAGSFGTLAGNIAARSEIGANSAHLGSILVIAGPGCDRQITFGIAATTRLVRYDHAVIPFDSLTVGRRVLVQYSGVGIMSCPPAFGADVVTLEPTP